MTGVKLLSEEKDNFWDDEWLEPLYSIGEYSLRFNGWRQAYCLNRVAGWGWSLVAEHWQHLELNQYLREGHISPI